MFIDYDFVCSFNKFFKVGDWILVSEKGSEKGIGVVKFVLGLDNVKV